MRTALDDFNEASDEAAAALLLGCAAVARWAEVVAAGRPYPDVEAALDSARTAAQPWSDTEIDAALARHPRIGERATGDDEDARHSRREQSGVDTSDTSVAARLRQRNQAYEERFGHVFLIRAAGRSATEILAALEQRLGNDPVTERRIAGDQLREIAVLRLQRELA